MSMNWWLDRKEELLALADEQGPLYVYNEETLNDFFFDLLCLDSLEGLFYPLYANPHPKIIRKALDLGLGLSCASGKELEAVSEQFPQSDARPMLWLGLDDDPGRVFPGLPPGVSLMVKDPLALQAALATYPDRDIYLYFGPGIEWQTRPRPLPNIKGFYASQNSLLSDGDDAKEVISSLSEASILFPGASHLILGKGATTSQNQKGEKPDRLKLENYLEAIKAANPHVSLWLEVPLDWLASSGLVLVKVLQKGICQGDPYLRLNLAPDALSQGSLNSTAGQALNLVRPEEAMEWTRVMGPWQCREKALKGIRVPCSTKKGDILVFPDRGILEIGEKIDDRGRNKVAEHYLPARRICQVKL